MLTTTATITRVLRELGLTNRGGDRDFRVKGLYRAGERVSTYVVLYGTHACQVAMAAAERIEAATLAAGYPFTVTVRKAGTASVVSIHN